MGGDQVWEVIRYGRGSGVGGDQVWDVIRYGR